MVLRTTHRDFTLEPETVFGVTKFFLERNSQDRIPAAWYDWAADTEDAKIDYNIEDLTVTIVFDHPPIYEWKEDSGVDRLHPEDEEVLLLTFPDREILISYLIEITGVPEH